MRAAGRTMPCIGKQHFRGPQDDNGFTVEIDPLHINNAQGWVHGQLRARDDLFYASGFATHIGPGDVSYSRYNQKVCTATEDWLKKHGEKRDNTAFGLYVSFLRPHHGGPARNRGIGKHLCDLHI